MNAYIATIAVQLPKQQQIDHQQIQELEQIMEFLQEGDHDSNSLREIEDETHPLAPVQPMFQSTSVLENKEEDMEGLLQRCSTESTSSSQDEITGQDFSHMYAQPTVIDVQVEEEEEKGIEVLHIEGIAKYLTLGNLS